MILMIWLFAGIGSGVVAQDRLSRDSQAAITHIQQGSALVRTGQMDTALEEFKAAVRADPTSAQAYVWLGITENQLGHFRDAVVAFQAALKLDATSQAAHYNLSLSLARLGKNQEAIRELYKVVRVSPDMADAQYNLAVLLEQEGNYNESIPHLKAALHQHPGDEDIALRLIVDDFKSGADHDAMQLAQDTFSKDSGGSSSARLGALLVKNGHFGEAVPMLESAVHSQAPSLELTILLGRAYIGSDSSEKAIELLQPIENSDTSGEAAYLLGLAYSSTKQPGAAVEAFHIATERRPDDALTHAQLGKLLLSSAKESEQDAGVEEMHKAIDLVPDDGAYYVLLGRWLLSKNQPAAALPVLQHGTENAQPSAELYLLLSVAEASLQSTQLAEPTVEKAIALDPKMALAHDLLGFCYFRVGDYSHAADSYKTATALSPQTARFAYDAALALERANKPAEAIPYAEKAAKLDPSSAMDHYLLGKLYGKVEHKPEAIQELETAIRLNPSLDYPYYLLARMYMRLGDTAKAQEWNLKFQELKKQQMKLHGVDSMSSEPRDNVSPALLLGGQQMDPEAPVSEEKR